MSERLRRQPSLAEPADPKPARPPGLSGPQRSHWALSIRGGRPSLEPSTVEGLITRWLPAPLQLVRHGWLPQGLSLFGSSPELTLVLHTWPEHGAASLDLFFGHGFDAQHFVAQLTQASGWSVVLAEQCARPESA